jgi:hypothetical protein
MNEITSNQAVIQNVTTRLDIALGITALTIRNKNL